MKRTSVNRNRAALKKQNRSDRTEHNDRGQRRRQPLGLSPSPRLAGLLIEPPNDPRFRKCVPEILARRLPYATIISKATIRTKSPRNKLGEPIDVVFYRKQRMFYAIISIKDLAFAFKGEGYSQEMIEEGSMSI